MGVLKSHHTKNHFIISAPRSGTTWLSTILNTHPQINCVERRLFGNYADFVLDDNATLPRLRVTLDKYVNSLLLHHGLPKQQHDQLLHNLIQTLIAEEKTYSGKNILIDKITPYINTSHLVLQQIDRFFPKAKLIFLVRDGRDVLTSGVFHWFNKQPNDKTLSDFELKRRQVFLNQNDTKFERFFQDQEIQQWGKEWKQSLQIIETAKKTHEVKIIFYEDLLKNAKKVLDECLTFLSAKTKIELINKCLEAGSFKTMSDGREVGETKHDAHIRKGVAGDWKTYFTYQDAKLFQEVTENYLVTFGYENNEHWFERFR